MMTPAMIISSRPLSLAVGHSVRLSDTHWVSCTSFKRYEANYVNLAGGLIAKPTTTLKACYVLADACNAEIIELRKLCDAS